MSEWNAKITRIDQPEPGLLSISIRHQGSNESLVLATLPGILELGLIDRRPRGTVASPNTTKLRHHIDGARITDVSQSARAIRVSLARSDTRYFLIATASKPYGAWWLCDEELRVIVHSPGAAADAPDEEAHLHGVSPQALRADGAAVLERHQAGRRRQLLRLLARQIRRVSKKREAIAADVARAQQADALRDKASRILAHMAEIAPNATYFDAPPWDASERPVRIELDPSKSPAQLAEEFFARAKRLARGMDVAPERLEAAETELAELEALCSKAADTPPAELAATLEERGIGIADPQEKARTQRRPTLRLPYRTFSANDGTTVLVGRGAADNDRLTLRVARPHDLWLHARGVTGAHVVVPLVRGKSCSPEALVDAATLAAHFSELRGEPVVDVLHTPRRFVRKRKGSPVGSVTLEREKVIAVRIEPERLKRLLDLEKKRA